MQTIELKKGLKVELETIIIGLSRLGPDDLSDFFAQLNRQVRQIAPPLDTAQQEILLLKQTDFIENKSAERLNYHRNTGRFASILMNLRNILRIFAGKFADKKYFTDICG